MTLKKNLVSPADIEAQTALELPDRQTLCSLIFVVVGTVDALSGNTISVLNWTFNDINTAVAACNLVGQVNVLNANAGNQSVSQTCTITQTLDSATLTP